MWQTEMVTILRGMIDDTDLDNPTYANSRLEQVILIASQLVLTEANLSVDYEVDVDEMTLSPDPTDWDSGRDNTFINLVLLKSGCIIETSEAKLAANQGVTIADGSSRISLSGKVAGKMKLWQLNYCLQYREAKDSVNAGRASEVGAIILGPYRSTGSYPNPYPIDGRYR